MQEAGKLIIAIEMEDFLGKGCSIFDSWFSPQAPCQIILDSGHSLLWIISAFYIGRLLKYSSGGVTINTDTPFMTKWHRHWATKSNSYLPFLSLIPWNFTFGTVHISNRSHIPIHRCLELAVWDISWEVVIAYSMKCRRLSLRERSLFCPCTALPRWAWSK